jgi:hypothetical protein
MDRGATLAYDCLLNLAAKKLKRDIKNFYKTKNQRQNDLIQTMNLRKILFFCEI